MARRYLGLSTGEWDALPWHVAQTYLEGFEEEGLIGSGEPETQAQPGAKTSTERDGITTKSTSTVDWDGDLSGYAFNVERIGG